MDGNPLLLMWEGVRAAADVGKDASERGDWDTAREAARAVLSHGSKLHARLGMLVDLRSDAAWKAAVDRTLAKERRQRMSEPPEIEGQMSVDEVIHPEKPGSPARRKRKS